MAEASAGLSRVIDDIPAVVTVTTPHIVAVPRSSSASTASATDIADSSWESITSSAVFRKRRALNWLTLGFNYSALYMGRYNLTIANPFLSEAYGWDKTQVGGIITPALLAYGLSAMVNGPIADKIGGRKAILVGTIGSLFFNFLFGIGAYLGFLGNGAYLLSYFSTVWMINNYFQSFGAVSLIKVNSAWFHISERGIFSAIFGSMIQLGRLFVFVVGPALTILLPWQWLFFVPSIFLSIMAMVTYMNVRNAPDQCGFPHLDVQDASSEEGHHSQHHPVSFKYLFKKIFTNPVTLSIAFAEFCTGAVRHGFEQWFPRYMMEVQKFDSVVLVKNVPMVVAAGIVGAMTAGILSDKVFNGRRTPVAFIGYLLQILSLGVVTLSPNVTYVLMAFVVNSLAISMVQSMLSGAAAMDFGGKKAAATAVGFFDGMQYVGGSVVAGIGMGWLLDNFGWGSWGPGMMIFSAIGMIIMMVLWNAKPKALKK